MYFSFKYAFVDLFIVELFQELEMLSAENKPSTFNNLISKETLHMYIFVQVTFTLNR